MSTTILATKLFIPPPRAKIVLRPRLIEQLNEGLSSGTTPGMTLISAAAGFGKTTLVSEWIAACGKPVAWLSLDEGDSDPLRFISYLIAALQAIKAGFGEGLLAALQSPQSPPIESILTALLNEITTIPDNFILILDDYHAIDSQSVDQCLTFLVEHLPPQMHLVIATREDPDLPLSRLRVRGQLTELRAADLRFTPAEATDFLIQMMGLNLSDEDVAALEAHTEGWIAGLQLAALSMQGLSDPTKFIQSFSGSHRFVLDYLLEEVLERQPVEIQNFLLCNSILERLCGPLCESLLGTPPGSGQETLEALERANLFLVPLDNERRWYRHHHLFGELLRQRLGNPQELPEYHLRASAWYEANADLEQAISHALAARDFEQAARLAEMAWPETFRSNRQNTIFQGWMKALPDEIIHARPVLCAGYAWALQDMGEFENARHWLDLAENPPAEALFVDEAEFQTLPGNIAVARAYVAMALGDAPEAERQARRALALLPEADLFRRAGATAIVGMASLQNGNLEAAARAIIDGMEMAEKAGSPEIALSGVFPLVDIRLVQGRLREAIKVFENLLEKTQTQDETAFPGTPDLYLGLCGLLLEQGDTETAQQFLQKSDKLGETAGLPDWGYRSCLTHARYLEILGDLDGALEQMKQAERLYTPSALPNLRPPNALKARLIVKQGQPDEALAWAREQGLSVENDLNFFQEFEHLTLARALGAEHEVPKFLDRLLQAAEAGGRTGSVIEILILQALTFKAQDDNSRSFASLERALTLAGPQGYLRIFVDEGEAMRLLLLDFRSAHEKQAAHSLLNYVDKILAAFSQPEEIASQSKTVNPKSKIIEPLTDRELEILRLIAEGQSNTEISQQLYVALSTVKGHNLRIFNKLQAQNRTEAVARARELGLI
jgi:LuxR family transcriptional regulator, maltose regulon positive regulatory protein